MTTDQRATSTPAVIRAGRSTARAVAVVAALLAVADLFRWGNRWYVTTMFERSGTEDFALMAATHSALVSALVWLLLGLLAAAVGWRLRIVRPRIGGR